MTEIIRPLTTPDRVRRNFEYYGLAGEDLEAAVDAYMERVEDGNEPDQAEFAEAWAALG